MESPLGQCLVGAGPFPVTPRSIDIDYLLVCRFVTMGVPLAKTYIEYALKPTYKGVDLLWSL